MSPVTEYTTDTFKIHQLEEDDNDNNDYTKNSGQEELENVDKNDDENDDKNDDENNDYYGDGVN